MSVRDTSRSSDLGHVNLIVVLCPEIFQIQSASPAKKHSEKNTEEQKVEYFIK